MNLLITKSKREKLLDEFANSSLPIDLFCEMHHVKQEVIKKALHKKTESLKAKYKPENKTDFSKSDFLELEIQDEPEIEKVSLAPDPIDKTTHGSTYIRITIGNSVMEIPININQNQLSNILTVVKTL